MFSMSFPSLPVELVCLVLSYLDIADVLKCSLLNHHFRRIIYDSSQIQYAIELVKHKLVSVASSEQHPSYARRLRILQEREHSWRHMRWKGRHSLRLPFTGSVYDFVGGIYGNGGDDNDGTTASLSFLKLPSLDDKIPQDQVPKSKLWLHLMPDLFIFDFTMDPSQDLLVLLALAPPLSKNIYELHLRTLSTNEPHPHAQYSRIPCLPGSYQDIALSDLNPAVTIQVIGDLVAVLFKDLILDLGARLEIWNWKLGPKHSSVMHRVAGIDDFTFLSEDSFLLVRPSEKLEVYKFAPPTSRSSIPQCLVSLELPLLSNQYRYWYITMSSNPTPGHVPHFPHPPPAGSGLDPSNLNVRGSSSQQLYYPAPNDRILACCLYIFDITQPQDASVRSFVFFVNVGTFLKPVEYWLSAMPNHCFASPLNRGGCRMHTEHGESSSPAGVHAPHTHSDSNSVVNDYGQNTDNPLNSLTSNPAQNIVGDNRTSMSFAVNQGATGTISQGYQSLQAEDSETDLDLTSSVYSTSGLSSSVSSSSQASLFLSDGEFSSPAGSTRSSCIWRMQPGSYPSIPWEVWGPQNTRWFNGNWRTDWQHATYGLRTADSVRVRQKSSTNGKSEAMSSKMENTRNENEYLSDIELDEEIDTLGGEEDEAEIFNDGPGPLRVLRVRDYNPCSIAQASEYLQNGVDSTGTNASHRLYKGEAPNENAKGNSRLRVVTEPSITPVHGVYKEDIKSWLPYVEVLSKETFDVTDVMLDDRRLLLLKRGSRGLLISIDVLMM